MNDLPSSADFIQASRVLSMSTPLGEDVLLPERAVIEEAVNDLFTITLSVRSKTDVAPADLIGKLVDVELEVAGGDDNGEGVRRPFNGLVTELHAGPRVTRGFRSYQLQIVPQLWLLSQRSDCRIWLGKSALDVLDTLLSEHGLPAADNAAVVSPVPAEDYSVQYNETDLAYVLRRLQTDGLFFWFSHEKGAHRLHVADQAAGWNDASSSAQGESRVRLAMGSTDRNHISSWMQRFAYVPGKRAGADWNHMTPRVIPLNATPSLVRLPENHIRELYEYPARAKSMEEADRVEKLRSQASEADHEKVSGASTVRILEPGRRFTPYEEGNPDADYQEHVIVRATHEVVDRSYETNADGLEYRNTFDAIPARVPLTPHRSIARPRIEGAQVAIVAGPEGEEIHPNELGEIKLWFPWDRRAKKDGTDTRWIRVAQPWSGASWGSQVIPRIGMEVMVAFIDGDPDRPLVVGSVPNPVNHVHYPLPRNKTRMVLRSKTHKGDGFNELRFEDEKDHEEVFVHAQKDQNIKVENNYSKRINVNKVESVGLNKAVEVANNAYQVVGGNMNIKVGPSHKWTITPADADKAIEGIGGVTYGLGSFANFAPGGGNLDLAVQANKAQSIGDSHTEVVGKFKRTQVGKDYHVRAEGEIVLDAGEKIVLNCGKSRIVLHSDGTVIVNGKRILETADEVIDMRSDVVKVN